MRQNTRRNQWKRRKYVLFVIFVIISIINIIIIIYQLSTNLTSLLCSVCELVFGKWPIACIVKVLYIWHVHVSLLQFGQRQYSTFFSILLHFSFWDHKINKKKRRRETENKICATKSTKIYHSDRIWSCVMNKYIRAFYSF